MLDIMMTQIQLNEMALIQGGSEQSHIGAGLCSALGGALIGAAGAGISIRTFFQSAGPFTSYGLAVIAAGIAIACYINDTVNLDVPLGL